MIANSVIVSCSQVITNFTRTQSGWLVWMNKHIGIYIEDGIVIESTAAWEKKVLRSYCKRCGISNKNKLHERQWTKCGLFDKFIHY